MSVESIGTPHQAHSYKDFSGAQFYERVNGAAADLLPGKYKRVANPGAGIGENYDVLRAKGKLDDNAQSVLFDIDRGALKYTRETHQDQQNLALLEANADKVSFVRERDGSQQSTHFPIRDGWADLVIGFNFIHLLDNPQDAIREMARISQSGAPLLLNTTYEYDRARKRHPHSNRILGLVIGENRRELAKLGYTDIPNPKDFARFTEEQYIEMMKDAGYVDIKAVNSPTQMDRSDFRSIFSYADFLEGTSPGVPIEVSRKVSAGEVKDGKLLTPGTIDKVFDAKNVGVLDRDWLILLGTKA